MQVAARINQDQMIAKDLSLWNQQGSQVLRAQTLVLPLGNTFLYVEPIYIQATEARMPQLRKVVLAAGNRLIYTDTYDQGLAQISGGAPAAIEPPSVAQAPAAKPPPTTAATATGDARIPEIRRRLGRYRELVSQGRWSEAGRELEAIEAAVK
jgi:uncharacterized membrane protein (UPF0182 family)